MKRYLSFLTLASSLALLGVMRSASAEPIAEYDMKAAYIFNFAKLTTWPVQSDNIRLCLLGDDRFQDSLRKLTRNATGGTRIQLRYLPNIQAVDGCQILFIDGSEHTNRADILKQLDKMPVLTVTDNIDLFNAGVMIGLFVSDKRLVFDVNYAQAKNAGLSVSSKLLHVARKVLQ